MIQFTCPSCHGKCSVGDEFSGRKLKCPKCKTRIRHHVDGSIELLSVGEPPPPSLPAPTAPAPPAAPAPAPAAPLDLAAPPAPAPPPPAPAPAKDSTVAVAVVPELVGKLVGKSESQQNVIIAWGAIGFLAAVLSVIGLVTMDMILATVPIGAALLAACVWLALRIRAKQAALEKMRRERAAQAPPPKKDEEKTEPLPTQR